MAEIARQAGVSQQFVNQVVAGRARPSRKVADAAIALGIPMEVFYEGERSVRMPSCDGVSRLFDGDE